ncbi:MAG TPA: DNA translocase FtsK 4TM domain-containing protein, partial [Kofleriaceae bacterium]|nr:DNA translocase FtsK 4TM domain-containing protein [Kofleriaceae bacterium]
MSKNRKISSTSSAGGTDRRREVVGVIGLGAGLFLLIAMISLQAHALVMGPFGRTTAGLFYGIAGMCGYLLIGLGVAAAIRMLLAREPAMPPLVVAGTLLGVVALATLVHLIAPHYRVAGHGPGGAIGEHLAEILRAMISTAGTALLALVGLVVAVVIATPLRMSEVLHAIWAGLRVAGGALRTAAFAFGRFWADVFRALLPERDRDEDDEEDEEVEEEDVLEATDDEHGPEPLIIERGDRTQPSPIEVVELLPTEKKKRKKEAQKTEVDLAVPGPAANDEDVVEAEAAPKKLPPRMAKGTIAPPAPEPEPTDHAGPVIFEPKFKAQDKAAIAAKEKQADAERQTFIKLGEGDYQLPSLQLLNYDAKEQNSIDKTAMLELSAKLTQTLENYGVKGDVVAIRPGPVVTMYEFAPAPGTRVNKIVNLTDDLALALEALRVRIVAPIPGKAAVGIEVPNKTREKVFIKEILADDVFRKAKARLPMAVGKDIEGAPFVVDMARMPHLLVAGTTGSGKSVGVNSMITSLLYHCSPEDVRMIMVDPK